MIRQPLEDRGQLVGGDVVQNDMDIHVGSEALGHMVEKGDEVLGAMPLGHAARGDIQGGQKAGGVMADIVMGPGRGVAGSRGQGLRSASQGWDLRLLVDGQHDRMVRRVHVQTDNITDLPGKGGIPRDLEGRHPMGVQPVSAQNGAHARHGHARLAGQGLERPVARMLGRWLHRRLNHLGHLLQTDGSPTGRAGLVPPQTGDAFRLETIPPTPYGELGHARATHGLEQAMARAQRQDDAGSPDMLRRRLRMGADLFQALAVGAGQDNGGTGGPGHDPLRVRGMKGPVNNRSYLFQFNH